MNWATWLAEGQSDLPISISNARISSLFIMQISLERGFSSTSHWDNWRTDLYWFREVWAWHEHWSEILWNAFNQWCAYVYVYVYMQVHTGVDACAYKHLVAWGSCLKSFSVILLPFSLKKICQPNPEIINVVPCYQTCFGDPLSLPSWARITVGSSCSPGTGF